MEQPHLGKRISKLRKDKCFTQQELAEQCKVSVRTLQRIENGVVIPRAYTVRAIFAALGCDFPEKDDLLMKINFERENNALANNTVNLKPTKRPLTINNNRIAEYMNISFYHIKVFLRNLQRDKFYSAINIGGLTIGMAASALLLVWALNQLSYDRFHSKAKQIYQVWDRSIYNNGLVSCKRSTSLIIGPTLKDECPEIVESVRVSYPNDYYFGEGDRHLSIRTQHVDPSFLTMFSFPLLQGDVNTALNDPYSIILTEKAARRLFGNEDPLGKTLMCDAKYPVTVTGVMKDLPNNTRFGFEILGSFQFVEKVLYTDYAFATSWYINVIETYVELTPHAQLDRLNVSICDIVKKHIPEGREAFLYSLDKSYLYNMFDKNGFPSGGLITFIRISAILAGIILLLACINFVNLSIARATSRAKEVGVRKALGSRRTGLIRLFLGESVILACISGFIAFILVDAALPYFSGWLSGLSGKAFSLDIFEIRFWIFALAFIVFTGLLAGSYPAFYLSAISPVKVLKGNAPFSVIGSRITLRKILFTFQFFVAIFLIICASVVRRQIVHTQNRSLGYDIEHLIYIPLTDDIKNHYQAFRNDLMTSGAVKDVARTSAPLPLGQNDGVRWRGKDSEASIFFSHYFADGNWSEMMGVELVSGRYPDPSTFPTDSSAFLLSESAVKTMGFEDPIGEIISFWGHEGQVTGVIKDVLFSSPLADAYPVVIGCNEKVTEFNTLHIRLSSGKTPDKLASVESIYRQYSPGYPFDYKFIDEEYEAVYFGLVRVVESLTDFFTVIAVLISCMGLFALITLTSERRRKEIGIRKILGASVADITLMLSKEYLILTIVAFVIAAPLAWFVMFQVLNSIPYRTNIPVWLIAMIGAFILLIATLTVGFQAIKAATANPVNAIKTE